MSDNGNGSRLEAGAPRNVARREMTWVLLWAAFVMLLTCIPYIYAVKTAGGRTLGGFIWGVDEGNVYLTWMRQASEGEVFFRNQYSTAPENPRFFNLFLQLGGRIGGLLGVDMKTMFHVLRLLGGMFLLVSFYLLVAELTRDRVARWAALALASLGSGFGWLIVLVWPQSGVHPVDVGQAWQTQPEAVTFLSLLLNGLFTTSMALMCLTFVFVVRAVRDGDMRSAVWGGVCLLVLGNIHTYDVFAVWLALGALAIGNRELGMGKARRRVGLIVLIGLPSVIWAIYATYADPAFLSKGLTPTPAFRLLDYVVAYGLVGLLSALGAVVVSSRPRVLPSSRLPLLWAVANALVLLIPVSFQRKMIEGLHLPLCILAGFAVSWLAHRITRGLRERGKHKHATERIVLTVCAVVVLCIPSNALFVSQCLQNVKTNNADLLRVLQPPMYLEAADARAMEWLGQNAKRDDVILSSSLMGSYLPTYCQAKVWVGHWAETLDFEKHLQALQPIYAPVPWETLLTELRDLKATMVYYGPYEQALTGGTSTLLTPPPDYVPRWLHAASQTLDRLYDAEGVRVYRVPEGMSR